MSEALRHALNEGRVSSVIIAFELSEDSAHRWAFSRQLNIERAKKV
jgi:hypothetical protein